MKNTRTFSFFQRAVAIFFGGLICMASSGSSDAAVVVYHSHAIGSVSLDDQSSTYSGPASFSLELAFMGGWNYPEYGSVRAWSRYGASSFNSNGTYFQTVAITSAEHRDNRIARSDAFWEFSVEDADTTFGMNAFSESRGIASWSLLDLTLNTLVGSYTTSGWGGDGNNQTGTLLSGHSYRLTESAQTRGTSDELAQLNFSVGTDVRFLPSAINPVPETGAFLTNATFLLTVGGMGWWHRRRGHGGQARVAR